MFNIIGADTYDVIIDKKMMASSPSAKGNFVKPSSNNIINDNTNNFNPKQITIEDMLKGVKDPDGKVYFQSAYHGTRVKGIEKTGFDLSYALSAEGAQAHGYGVYLAKTKMFLNVTEKD